MPSSSVIIWGANKDSSCVVFHSAVLHFHIVHFTGPSWPFRSGSRPAQRYRFLYEELFYRRRPCRRNGQRVQSTKSTSTTTTWCSARWRCTLLRSASTVIEKEKEIMLLSWIYCWLKESTGRLRIEIDKAIKIVIVRSGQSMAWWSNSMVWLLSSLPSSLSLDDHMGLPIPTSNDQSTRVR